MLSPRPGMHSAWRGLRCHALLVVCCVLTAMLGVACSSTRYVPEGQLLEDKVKIVIDDSVKHEIVTEELYNYLRQAPNHKVLGFAKLQLGIYNMSGSDTSHWYNRWLRRMGQAPVIHDNVLTEASKRQLRLALVNRGYLGATVEVDSVVNADKKKIELTYRLTPGQPHTISSVSYDIPDTAIASILLADTALMSIPQGMPLDRDWLEQLRGDITRRLRNHGYYGFSKEYVSFTADTARGSRDVDLTLTVNAPRPVILSTGNISASDSIELAAATSHRAYFINKVYFVTDYNPVTDTDLHFQGVTDTVHYRNIEVLYGRDHYIKPSILDEKCFITPGKPYNAQAVERTYEGLGQLGIVRFISIEMKPVGMVDGKIWLNAYVLMSRAKKQGVEIEVEGTNSEGDLGFGVGLTYQHRNIGHRSEALTAKFRTSYESLSGNFDGFVNNRYSEYAAEVALALPKFEFPFVGRKLGRRFNATTEFSNSFNYQERPEYTRIIAGLAWKYRFSRRGRGNTQIRHQFDLIDINLVSLPRSTIDFLNQIAPDNPLLRYSYEDHFIMRMGYTFYRTNRRIPSAAASARRLVVQPSVYSLRTSVSVAGNLLWLISSLDGARKHDGAYKVFGIPFSQYAKAEFDYSYVRNFDTRNSIAVHGGFGIGYPYGNSRMIPFEQRFYAGGANGVRGWSVRTLGPGSYNGHNSVTDFINQCGDIRLDASIEYRAKLFWVFEAGVFIDAGNIWTIHNYPSQPGGMFHFNKFYKQIALAYGAGLRMDFTYFLLRFDLGFKAHNPAEGQEPWPIAHFNWHRDATFHFAVGYPF